jgi:hypothetical protein
LHIYNSTQDKFRQDSSLPTNTASSSSADPHHEDTNGGNADFQGSTQAIVRQVTHSLKEEFRETISSSTSRDKENSKLIDSLRLQQNKDSTFASAHDITSEGAKKQYIAFAKIKIGITEVREKLENHNVLGALGVLEEIEKIADIRLNLIKRADSCPGGWSAATDLEDKLTGVSNEKKDKLWDASAVDLKTKQKSGKVATRSRPKYWFSQRDEYNNNSYGAGYNYGQYNSPFQSVPPCFLTEVYSKLEIQSVLFWRLFHLHQSPL